MGWNVAASCVALGAAAFAARYFVRSGSAVVRSKVACNCGKVTGEICANSRDVLVIKCFCNSCQDYANHVAAKKDAAKVILDEEGGSHIVQVCKTDLVVHSGIDQLHPCRVSECSFALFRFYAKCCGTPMFNTAPGVGFVGVPATVVQDIDKFPSPGFVFVEEAVKEPSRPNSSGVGPAFVYNFIRYLPYKTCGPQFPYEKEVEYYR
uniref:CENP-V/GFA domain-containing protein n=1 Tax=Mucochytrium quahogii TaxID=96639 RepID=A0A7S2S5R8_9STRA|mmetsp:Transcript_15885/g.25928  ORF Transcript_15885/g.25928 Transcript_15885/m.25928 type:complete len:207 (-) Transcript_15885:3627-4247(-)